MTQQEVERILKVAFMSQYFNECLDDIEGEYLWKHDLKRYGNLFRKELDKLLDGILTNVSNEEKENYNAILIELRKAVDNVYNEITVTQ